MTQRQSNIFLVLSILVIASGYAAWKFSDSGKAPLSDVPSACAEPVPLQAGVNTVILRLDDVQTHHLTDVNLRMMQDAIARDMPIVAGVIASGIKSDRLVVDFLKNNPCMVEVAVHGLDHKPIIVDGTERGEYAFLTKEEARSRTERALTELDGITTDRPLTFIPPYNEISNESRVALFELGFTVISASGKNTYDFDSGTWDFDTAAFVNADKVMDDCLLTFANDDRLCVVMLHPQDYIHPNGMVNETRYAEYLKLLDTLKAHDNIQVTRFDTHHQALSSN